MIDAQTLPTRRRAVVFGATFGVANVLFLLIRNIVLVPVYLQHLTIYEYGAWVATGATLIQILVTDMGLSGALAQRVAKAYGEANQTKLSKEIGAGISVSLLLCIFSALLAYALTPILVAPLKLEAQTAKVISDCILIAIIGNAANVLSGSAVAILRGLQRPAASGLIQLSSEAASLFVTVFLLYKGIGVYALAWGVFAKATVLFFFTCPYMFFVVRKHHQIRIIFCTSSAKSMGIESAYVFVSTLSLKSIAKIDTFVIGLALGSQVSAVYSVTVRAHETIVLLLSQINSALGPSLAHLYGSKQNGSFGEFVVRTTPLLAGLTAIGLGAVIVANSDFVRLWVGPQMYAGSTVNLLAAISMVIAGIGYSAYDSIVAKGDFRYTAIVFAPLACIHFALLYLLLPFGIWAASATNCVTSAAWAAFFWDKFNKTNMISKRAYRNAITGCTLIVAITASFSQLFLWLAPTSTSWGGLMFKTAAFVALCAMTSLAVLPDLREWLLEESQRTLKSFINK